MEVNLLEVTVSRAQEQLKSAEKELSTLDGKQKSKRAQSWEHVGCAGPRDGEEVGGRLQEEMEGGDEGQEADREDRYDLRVREVSTASNSEETVKNAERAMETGEVDPAEQGGVRGA